MASLDKYKQSKISAFTLVEVIIAACIFSLIAIGLGSIFISGTKLWQRAQNIGVSASQVMLELEGISRNIRQSLDLEEVGFVGKERSFEFPTVIGNSIFKIIYDFDNSKKKLFVKKIKYEDILAKKIKEPQAQEVLKADNVEFEYLIYETGDISYSWESDFDKKGQIPVIVKVSIEKGEEEIEKSIFVPVGYGQK